MPGINVDSKYCHVYSIDMDLTGQRNTTYTLPELAGAVARFAAAMAGATPGAARDERVSVAPDERTLRYYQSLGVMDRPIRYDGRQAIYGYRHLLQALAVKALQAEGHSLAQVQRALAGATDDLLEAAVLDAIGAAPSASSPAAPAPSAPAPAAPPAPAPRWVTAELAPGVLVSIDPSRWPDAEALLRAFAAALPDSTPLSGAQP